MWHIDYETYSRCDINKCGGFRYAEDPSTIILLCAISRGDEEPSVWDSTQPNSVESKTAWRLILECSYSDEPVYAHNAPFEMAISDQLWKKTFGCPPPKLERWRCTMAMARRAAMPSDLGELQASLKGQEFSFGGRKKAKDALGKTLIKIFSCPRKAGKLKGQRIIPTDEGLITVLGEKMEISEAWKLFREYNRQDVKAEQEVYNLLKPFDLKGMALRGFQFDARMNRRGVPVNRDAIRKAMKIVDEASAVDIARCNKLCGLNPTQVGKLLPWLQERGYPGENLQEKTMDDCLEKVPKAMQKEAVEVLKIRSRVAFSAVKKLPTMLRACCADGHVRGMLMWSGAIRTHRWSSKIIQLQNLKRPSIKDTHAAYEAICAGWDHEMIGMVWGNPVEVVASCIRHFIHDPECEFLDADFKNIEARITPWLAGQHSMLQVYRDGRDPYSEMAAKIFDKPGAIPTEKECRARDKAVFKSRYSVIEKNERFVGKQTVLLCGFQGGWEKFQVTCDKYGQEVDDELCQLAVDTYREENPEIVSMWKAMQRSAVGAIEAGPGETFKVRGKITFGMATTLPFPALLMRLPSGHLLCYPYPELKTIWIFQKQKFNTEAAAERAYRRAKAADELEEDDRVWKTKSIHFFGPNPITHQWGQQTTWGSKFFENAVQAIAGDFITHGCLKAEEKGYKVFLVVHDQALPKYRPQLGQSKEEFQRLLCTLPKWAGDFPLEASCDVVKWYTKED